MRLLLQLIPEGSKSTIPVNYQYPLSAAIYKIISRADSGYAAFLHEHGYKMENSLKTFKLFTFSDLTTPFVNKGDRIVIVGNEARLTVCFHVTEAASNFVRGLFLNQVIEIADRQSKVCFHVRQVEVQKPWNNSTQPDELKELILQPASPMVVGITNEKGNYDFLYPRDARYTLALLHHWKEKYRVVHGDEAADTDFQRVEIAVINADKARSRLITIKAGTPEETKIRGFNKFRLQVKAPIRVIELAMNAGIGVYGSQGMGCMDIIK